MDSQQRAFEILERSKLFREFQTAFKHATGVIVTFERADTHLAPRVCEVDSFEGELLPRRLELLLPKHPDEGFNDTIVVNWAKGLRETIVPVRVGCQVFGILRTGCMAYPERSQHFDRQPGFSSDLNDAAAKTLETSFPIPILDQERMTSIGKILSMFREYLAGLSNQLMLQQSSCEPAVVTRAKEFIKAHHRENVLLEHVAGHAHVSTFYLCKMFKRFTGLTFSDFLVRTRIETAKKLLLDRTRQINEIALAAGFQSLTHFNRVFKQLVGSSPRDFRKRTVL